jgi:aryl-alcohol dehydrogenase-like predicted oxidoreductase
MKLGLGTVQFGLDYGISNREGRTPENEVINILNVAIENGIRYIDTASLYGTSEEVLGRTLPRGVDFQIVTKTPYFSKSKISRTESRVLVETFYRSLERMRIPAVYGLLIHHVDDVLVEGGSHLIETMTDLQQRGLVRKIGVSVYTAEEIDRTLEKFKFDLIQVPINIFDQRLLRSGHLSKLKLAGIEIHARSIFLQGLLLMDPTRIPTYFDPVKEHLRQYHDTVRLLGLTPIQAALGFVTGLNEIDIAVCGVNTHSQLAEMCKGMMDLEAHRFAHFAIFDEMILNPALWKC